MDTTFTLTLPLVQAQRIAEAVCAIHGYNPADGLTPIEFTQQVTFRWLAEITVMHEARLAADAARNSVIGNANDPLAQAVLTQDTR